MNGQRGRFVQDALRNRALQRAVRRALKETAERVMADAMGRSAYMRSDFGAAQPMATDADGRIIYGQILEP